MRRLLISVPFAIIVSVVLVALSASMMTSPAGAGPVLSKAAAAVTLFSAMIYTGTALRLRKNRRR